MNRKDKDYLSVVEIGIVIVAAGSSSRLGQAKQLVPYQGKTLLQHTIDKAKVTGAAELLVVLGAYRNKVAETLKDVKLIYNEEWEKGMGHSIASGVRGLSDSIDGVMLLTCDQPYLSTEHLLKIMALAQENKEIMVSQYDEGSGPPCYFSKKYFSELQLLKGDKGAKSIIDTNKDRLTKVSFPKGGFDIDTLEDLERLFDKG